MARTSSNPRIINRTVRAKLTARRDPYWHLLAQGQHLGYRRAETGGTWVARYYTTAHGRRFQALGSADDTAPADGVHVLSFAEAVGAAQGWLRKVMQADGAGVVHNTRYTVDQALDDYLVEKESVKRKRLYRTRVIIDGHIRPTLGKIELSRLTHGRVKAWRDLLATSGPRVRTRSGKPQAYRTVDLSDPSVLRARQATANRILTVLKAALNYAREEGRVSSKAAWENVKPFRKVDVPKIRFLTTDEVKALIDASEPSFQTLLKAALLTGCRYGELTAMRVEAFDAEQGTVYIAESKNGEARYVDLGSAGLALFGELTTDRDAKATIFLRSNGKEWKESEQQRPMDDTCETAELEGVTFHILRHTYASHALMNGMTIEVLAQQLGHKDTRITMRHYAHLCPTFKQESVRRNAPSFGFDSPAGPTLVKKSA